MYRLQQRILHGSRVLRARVVDRHHRHHAAALGIDATNKWPAETQREWGAPIAMDAAVKKRVDEIWSALGL